MGRHGRNEFESGEDQQELEEPKFAATVSGSLQFPVSCVPCICNLAFVFEFYLSFLYKGVILLVLQKQERILMLFVTLFLNMFTKVRK